MTFLAEIRQKLNNFQAWNQVKLLIEIKQLSVWYNYYIYNHPKKLSLEIISKEWSWYFKFVLIQ